MSDVQSLQRFVREMPKVELHVHLEGSIGPRMLLELASKRRIDLPADTEKGLAEWFRFRDFDHFLEVYVQCSRCLREPEDFQTLVRGFMTEQAHQNVLYTEAHFTISTHIAHGVNAGEVGHAMAEAIAQAESDTGCKLRLIPDIVRNLDFKRADQTLEWALAHRDIVAALGISGKEDHPSTPFRAHFEAAVEEELPVVAHAGEQAGPDSIRATLEACRPQRIGHGIRCVEDESLVDELREKAIPLEVCPTSNIRLGYAADLSSHPVGELLDRGVELSINSDDPALFDTSLTEEYLAVAQALDLDLAAVAKLGLAAARHSFLPEREKVRMCEDLETSYSDLASLSGSAVGASESA